MALPSSGNSRPSLPIGVRWSIPWAQNSKVGVMGPKTQKWASAHGQEFENKMASLGRIWNMGKCSGLEFKNKKSSLSFKRMAFKMASSWARFWLSTLSLVCCQDGKTPGTPNALTFWNLHAPYALGPGTRIRKQNGVVGVKIKNIWRFKMA